MASGSQHSFPPYPKDGTINIADALHPCCDTPAALKALCWNIQQAQPCSAPDASSPSPPRYGSSHQRQKRSISETHLAPLKSSFKYSGRVLCVWETDRGEMQGWGEEGMRSCDKTRSRWGGWGRKQDMLQQWERKGKRSERRAKRFTTQEEGAGLGC